MPLILERRGLDRLLDQLGDLELRADALAPAFRAVADDFRKLQRARFAGGGKWAPVSPEWAARKAQQGRPRRPLVYSGQLEASFASRSDRYHREDIGRDELVVKSRSPLLNIVASTNPGRGHDKRRQLVELSRADRRRWVRIVERYLLRGELP